MRSVLLAGSPTSARTTFPATIHSSSYYGIRRVKHFIVTMTILIGTTLLAARGSTAFLLPIRRPLQTTTRRRLPNNNHYFGIQMQRNISRFCLCSSAKDLSAASDTSDTTIEKEQRETEKEQTEYENEKEETFIPPWSLDLFSQRKTKSKSNSAVRVRQHVNPLARRFQMQTILSDKWPNDVFDQINKKPLFLDIGAAKGGFLLKLASQRRNDYNYLGLEIRPLAVQFAKDRLQNNPKYSVPCTGHLGFVGCNANVDLKRLLSLYRDTAVSPTFLEMVTIQFPDPHFKASHAKRRVVTPELVKTLPEFMPPGAKVFLQSDVQTVLDDMRERFREETPEYFQDLVEDAQQYYPDNIIGIPTEREVSVLKQNLPVYRAVFVRTDVPFHESE